MSTLVQRLMVLTSFVCALLWGVAGWSKLADPLAAYELIALTMEPGAFAKGVVVAVIAGEVLLAVWMALGLSERKGLSASLGGLALFTGALLIAQERVGGDVPCGCLPSVLDSDVEGAITRNVFLCAWIAVLLLASFILRRRDAAAASDPATP